MQHKINLTSDIGRGRLEQCKESVGGIKNIYILADSKDSYDLTKAYGFGQSGDDATLYKLADFGQVDVWQFTPSKDSSFTENIVSSRESGTTYFESVLELKFPKLTKEDHLTMKLITYGYPRVLVEDNNNNVMIVAYDRGMSVTGGNIQSGASMNDMSGYSLTLTGEDKEPAKFLVERGSYYYEGGQTGMPHIKESGDWSTEVLDIIN